ncbi:hypothetical protein FB45DRAFT_261246 [Roridomyces roridus]|uniref:Uncharacterized protein n=1 Tax=Roridomyces roridus TaxID=1738132 RepID=A0AAD7B8L7_9AGAR|nr:hypothetical protein FB45DRAFT_261246 [Roridomyces roridus]
MAAHSALVAPPPMAPTIAAAPASPVSPTYTDFSSSSSSDFTTEIRSPLDDTFAHHQQHDHPGAAYAARSQGHAQNEFFAYQTLPWSSPVDQKKPLASTGYYAANVVFPHQQQQHILPALDLDLAGEYAPYRVAKDYGHHQQAPMYCSNSGIQRSYSAAPAYGYHQARAMSFNLITSNVRLVRLSRFPYLSCIAMGRPCFSSRLDSLALAPRGLCLASPPPAAAAAPSAAACTCPIPPDTADAARPPAPSLSLAGYLPLLELSAAQCDVLLAADESKRRPALRAFARPAACAARTESEPESSVERPEHRCKPTKCP